MVRKGLLFITAIVIASFVAPAPAQDDRSKGDRLIIENVDRSAGVSGVRPNRGMSMETVESRWGAPVTKRNAVGDPPITRWEYPTFVVYFEYRNVIHAVNTER